MSQARFQKQQREKARREKAAAKFAKKAERREEESPPTPSLSDADQAAVLAELAALHARFDAGEIEFDDFTEAKDDLTRRLDVR